MKYEFAGFRVDTDRIELAGPDGVIAVEPQVFDVLVYLIEARDRVVPKQELLESVWGHAFVTESTLTSRITAARQAIGDDGRRQELIRTAHGRGYRFVGTIVEDAATSRPDTPPSEIGTGDGLVGRDADLDAIVDHLQRSRLVTLTGPGGVGKTSLAAAVYQSAQALGDVWLVELLAVTSSNVVDAVAGALDVQRQRDLTTQDSLLAVLGSRSGLLVLDNAEHLVDEVASLVASVLSSCPDVRLLVTSRESLQVRGEQVYPVGPLDWRGGERGSPAPAVELFAQRASSVDPSFALDEANRLLVKDICQRLDGIPLAIELAAARSRAIDLADLGARLDERFRLLTTGPRDGDHRHRTLEDTIAWSYELLDPPAQALFCQLSCFAGPFDLQAAEAISDVDGDVLDLMTRLVDRSMVTVRTTGGVRRFAVLESLRAFGADRLDADERANVARRHADHYVDVAVLSASGVDSGDERRWIDDLDAAFDNLRAAFSHSVAFGDVAAASALVAGVREYAMRTMRYEVMEWASIITAVGTGEIDPTVIALRGYGAFVRGELNDATADATSARDLEESAAVEPSGLAERVLANCSSFRRDFARLQAECERQLEIAERSEDPARVAHAAYFLSAALTSVGDPVRAAEVAARGGTAAVESQSATALAGVRYAEALLVLDDDPAEARRRALECGELAASVGNRWMETFGRTLVGSIDLSQGDLGAARPTLAAVLDIWYRSGDWTHTWWALGQSIVVLAHDGLFEVAAPTIGAIERHAAIGAAPSTPAEQVAMFAAVDQTRDALGDRYDVLVARGRNASPGDLVHRARAALEGSAANPPA